MNLDLGDYSCCVHCVCIDLAAIEVTEYNEYVHQKDEWFLRDRSGKNAIKMKVADLMKYLNVPAIGTFFKTTYNLRISKLSEDDIFVEGHCGDGTTCCQYNQVVVCREAFGTMYNRFGELKFPPPTKPTSMDREL